MRILALAALLPLTSCKPVEAKEPCEFDLKVRVAWEQADAECRKLGGPSYRNDNGDFIKDTSTVLGCAPEGRIITNGTESNMGHEMKHQVERNCK